MSDFLVVTEVTTALRLSERSVRRLIAEGRLPARKLGRKWLIERSAVGDYLNAHSKTINHFGGISDGR